MSTTTNESIRDQLKAVRAQISTVRDSRADLIKARDDAKTAFAQSSIDITSKDAFKRPEFKAAEKAVANLGRSDDELSDLQSTERSLLGMLGEAAPPDPNGTGITGLNQGVAGVSWDASRLTAEGSRYRDARASGVFSSGAQFGSVALGQIATREEFLGMLSAADVRADVGSANMLGATTADRRGFVQPLLKALTLLDLIPKGITDSSSVEYVQVQAVPTGAVETAELAAKPALGLGMIDATAPVRTIAGYIKLARQALDDIPALGSLINTLLPYEVLRRVESQILAGDGVGQNLKGILNQTGIGAPLFVAGDNPADAILRAMTVVILSDGQPNFVALNPIVWQNLLLMREEFAGGKGQYLFGSPAMVMAPTIWGMAAVSNRVVPAATPLVGDANGAMLLVREAVNVRVSDSDSDDFTRNRCTVLAESRVALPVWRPASFAKVALS